MEDMDPSNWLTELRFYIPLNTKHFILETFQKPISWLGMEKQILTQQKHAFTNQNNVLQHKINMNKSSAAAEMGNRGHNSVGCHSSA